MDAGLPSRDALARYLDARAHAQRGGTSIVAVVVGGVIGAFVTSAARKGLHDARSGGPRGGSVRGAADTRAGRTAMRASSASGVEVDRRSGTRRRTRRTRRVVRSDDAVKTLEARVAPPLPAPRTERRSPSSSCAWDAVGRRTAADAARVEGAAPSRHALLRAGGDGSRLGGRFRSGAGGIAGGPSGTRRAARSVATCSGTSARALRGPRLGGVRACAAPGSLSYAASQSRGARPRLRKHVAARRAPCRRRRTAPARSRAPPVETGGDAAATIASSTNRTSVSMPRASRRECNVTPPSRNAGLFSDENATASDLNACLAFESAFSGAMRFYSRAFSPFARRRRRRGETRAPPATDTRSEVGSESLRNTARVSGKVLST